MAAASPAEEVEESGCTEPWCLLPRVIELHSRFVTACIERTSLAASGFAGGGPARAVRARARPSPLPQRCFASSDGCCCGWWCASSVPPYPFVPIARTKLYLSLSPTASGPVIDAVAKSG